MDYQSNTRKDQEQQAMKEKRVEKNIEKVVTGEVIQKPKGIGKKFKEIFFGGDARQAAKFVTADVLLPALRNLVVDMVTKGAERLIYGESQYRRRPNTNYSAQYQYQRTPLSRSYDQSRSAALPSPPDRVRQNRHEMNDIVLATKEEAELVAERLVDILEKYDVVSLADLYDLLGLETSYVDNKWGWTYLRTVHVSQIRNGYLLELPPLEEI